MGDARRPADTHPNGVAQDGANAPDAAVGEAYAVADSNPGSHDIIEPLTVRTGFPRRGGDRLLV
jgi:hypothetical protein